MNNKTIEGGSQTGKKQQIPLQTHSAQVIPKEEPKKKQIEMKFRAVMQEPQYMREFQNIVTMLSKLAKECVMNISGDSVRFIANEESGTVAPFVWVEIDAKLYFSEYTMEGATASHPHIMLSLSAANLARALGVLRQNARNCKIKLTNIQFPCLSVEATVGGTVEAPRHVVHDVPVTVIPRSDWHAYAVPQRPQAKVVLNVPTNRFMRGLLDKIKNLAPSIIFYATSGGELNIVAETEMATITTRHKNLELRALNPAAEDKGKEHIEASCSVDCKKTSLFFGALQLPTLELSVGIVDERLIHMEVNVREGVVVHTILPAVCM